MTLRIDMVAACKSDVSWTSALYHMHTTIPMGIRGTSPQTALVQDLDDWASQLHAPKTSK